MTDQPTPRPAALDGLLGYVAANLPAEGSDRPTGQKYPSQITVFCDHCGTERTGDYIVSDLMTRDERLAVARKHLVENESWEHTADGDDFCPEHAGSTAAEQPEGVCALCDVVKPDKHALRDHVLNVHPDEFCGIYHEQPCQHDRPERPAAPAAAKADAYANGICTYGEDQAPGSGCIKPAGHDGAHLVTPGDTRDIDDD